KAKAIAILRAAFDNSDGQGLQRFKQDLTNGMPVGASPAERDRYIFLQAATWPDIIRDEAHPLHGEVHKGEWHYINYPFVPPGDSIATPMDPVPTPLGMDPKDVVSAIRQCARDVKTPALSKRIRAARLCFLLHTVGDIHQPLHAAAMF